MPKIIQSTDVIEYNGDTGAVAKSTSSTVKQWEAEPPYVKMYLDTILYLQDLPKGHNSILHALLKRMTYANGDNGQCVFVNMGLKRMIGKELGVSVSRIDNVISDLTKGGVLERIERGVYQVNPHLFGRGEWADIAQLKLTVTFDANGKTVMGEIKRSKDNKDNVISINQAK